MGLPKSLRFGLVAILLLVALGALPAVAEADDLTVQPAVDGVMAAFATHPLVGIGEHHELAQEGDFYVDVVRDPRFAEKVGNVVVEFGGAAHQDTLDRYLSGEEVPYAELRRVWTDVVGWFPTVTATMYLNFFAQVRVVNASLPPEKRIKVWLGEPVVDWSRIKNREDLKPYQDRRDVFASELIERHILSQGKKALVIYGYPHFENFLLRSTGIEPFDSLWARIEKTRPGSFFIVRAYAGLPDKACSARFEAEVSGWAKGTLAGPLKGTWLGEALRRPGCPLLPPLLRPPGAPVPAIGPEMTARMEAAVVGAQWDALLYLGPEAGLTYSPWDPAFYLDEAYFREISRRAEILVGKPLEWRSWVREEARRPRPYVAR